jgi:hypothetical protein
LQRAALELRYEGGLLFAVSDSDRTSVHVRPVLPGLLEMGTAVKVRGRWVAFRLWHDSEGHSSRWDTCMGSGVADGCIRRGVRDHRGCSCLALVMSAGGEGEVVGDWLLARSDAAERREIEL